MIASAQTAMACLTGPGRFTVCRAKPSVLSTRVGPKVNLPDTHSCRWPKSADFEAGNYFLVSLTHSVPILFAPSPSYVQKLHGRLAFSTHEAAPRLRGDDIFRVAPRRNVPGTTHRFVRSRL